MVKTRRITYKFYFGQAIDSDSNNFFVINVVIHNVTYSTNNLGLIFIKDLI